MFDCDAKQIKLDAVLTELETPDLWKDVKRSQRLGKERTALQKSLDQASALERSLQEIDDMYALIAAEAGEDADLLETLQSEIVLFEDQLVRLEQESLFSGALDSNNAYLDVQAGSGGVEAQDWAAMLLRMYLRWGERHNFAAEMIEVSSGEAAGIKSATVHFVGENVFGWLRTESGVHRLVRKSPFDSGNRRHTSFASVFVSPEIDDDIEITIDPSTIRIDTYRASGAGGQHINKTDSAVRITHIPSGTVAQCQQSRSQHQNREKAIRQLRAKLYELERQKRENERLLSEEEKPEIGWGSQIRSYVLDQSRIKDLRTDVESSNPQKVLDGDLDEFIQATLKSKLRH